MLASSYITILMRPRLLPSCGLLLSALLLFQVACASEDLLHDDEEEVEPATAVLFPWFSEVLGVLTVYVLSRYCHALPYTAVMFVIGTLLGLAVVKNDNMHAENLQESIIQWARIDGELLLLVFLPGLLFVDAFAVNFHLFQASFWQLLIMAFPMVLAGTCLTALVGFYVFPYSWSWNLSMTFGSILAATDPVAVSALLNEVGAPPRLKMHVSGESMLNDGSAVVFFTIFGASFLEEIAGSGNEITVGEGFKIFFRMSLGGAAIGIAFGMGLMLLLFLLHRRLDNEENVLQVAATITIAYLSFFVAEILCHTSGVIAVVFCGITTQAFGSNMINDQHMMESFWVLVEYLLNTLLFTLGGVVWGAIVAGNEDREGFTAKDWGYLILLYVLVQAIRFFLVFAFYPLLSRIGLKSNWREAVFLSFGGLRGAVGIALALSLDSEVFHASEDENTRNLTNKLFGMVGGIALFTLVINGTFSGPLLKRLGLVRTSDIRNRIIQHYGQTTRQRMLDDFVHLLADPRFRTVDYSVIAHHVPILRGLSKEELTTAVRRNKESVPPGEYKEPFLDNVLPYLQKPTTNEPSDESQEEPLVGVEQTLENEEDTSRRMQWSHAPRENANRYGGRAIELRGIFIEILRYAYKKQVEKGELDGRGFLDYVLFQSLEFAADEVSMGKPLNDWEAANIVGANWTNRVEYSIHNIYALDCAHSADVRAVSAEYIKVRVDVKRALAFIAAHQYAQERFKSEFTDDEFSADEMLILSESESEVEKAEEVLHSYDRRDVEVIVSHLACRILLNKGARYMEYLGREGLLSPREACSYVESCDHAIDQLKYCSRWKHPGELTKAEKVEMMAMPAYCSATRNLNRVIDEAEKEGEKDGTEEKGL